MATMILIQCPHCQAQAHVREEHIGKRARCKSCREVFLIEPPSLEDSVMLWLKNGAEEEGEPSGVAAPAARRGAEPPEHGFIAPPRVVAAPSAAPVPKNPDTLRLAHVDCMGAFFLFPDKLLLDERFRTSLPRRCMCCGVTDGLNIHLVVWTSKLPDRDKLRLKNASYHVRPVTMEELARMDGHELLSVLPRVPNVPTPFDLPMPYFICNRCSPVGVIMTHVRPRSETSEECELGIASMKRAADFLACNLGRDHEDYQRLLEEAHKRNTDPWQALPLAVRNRIVNWFKHCEGERFLAYIADKDFARTEAGQGGLVVTTRRIVYHKFIAHREADLSAEIRLRPFEKEGRYALEINAAGVKRMVLSCDPPDVEALRELLRNVGANYTYHP